MCEPFSVVVHATRRLGVNIGDYVLITGAGAMGQMSLQAAKAYGAAKIAITDVNPDKLKLAKQLGADYTYQIDSKNFDPVELAEEIKKDMGKAPDITFECVGFASTVSLAIYATTNGGKIALIGLGPLEIPIPLTIAAMHEVDLYGVCRFAHKE
jgi:L-iditol 2-dehydrogenase